MTTESKLKQYIKELRELVSDNWFLDNPNDDVNEEITRLLDLLERSLEVIEFSKTTEAYWHDHERNHMNKFTALVDEFLSLDPSTRGKERGE